MRTTIPVDDTVREILAEARIDGLALHLPPRQLDRKVYKAVNDALEAIGGKWNRRAKAHLFASDPTDALEAVLQGGTVATAPKVLEAFFATPVTLAHDIVAESDITDLERGAVVLEPSAGDGALVRAILAANPDVQIVAVEPNADRAAAIRGDSRVAVVNSTLEAYAKTAQRQQFAAVVMNPPFALPGDPTAWISHVLTAWDLLAPGGQLLAIVPNGYTFRRDRRHQQVRDLISAHGNYRELPADTFVESGAGGIYTVLIHAHRPDITS